MFKLKVDPSFKASVAIPIPGGDPVPITFTFKHKTRKELTEFVDKVDSMSNADMFMEMVSEWGIDEKFNRDNVEYFLDNYHGAAMAVSRAYFDELKGVRTKN